MTLSPLPDRLPGQVPAGWYPDPEAPDVLRWWDGYRFTDDFAPRAVDPADSRNGYATASLVFGIVSVGFNVLFIPSIVGIAFGVSGLGKAKRMGLGRPSSIAGIVLSIVGIAAQAVLIALVLLARTLLR